MDKILFFSKNNCTACPQAKAKVKQLKNYEIEYIDVSTEEGKDAIEKYSLLSVPTVIEVDENNNEIKRHVGLSAINVFVNFKNNK